MALSRPVASFALATLSLVVAGCFPSPEREWHRRADLGCDACVMDPDAGDIGPDADIGAPQPDPERDCDDGIDNDSDTLVDCADFDCAGAERCCRDGATIISEDWTAPDLSFRWEPLPRSDPDPSPLREPFSGAQDLLGWDDRDLHALLYHRCAPLALGAEVQVDIIARSLPDDGPLANCAARRFEPCDQGASFALTRVSDLIHDIGFTEDLALHIHGHDEEGITNTSVIQQAQVRLTQAGVQLHQADLVPDVRYTVTLRLRPDVSGPRATLIADIELKRVNGAGEPIVWPGVFVAPLDTLLRDDAGCDEVTGLRFGLQMRGQGARVGPVALRGLECANPSQFSALSSEGATLDAELLGLGESYAGGVLGSPSLTSAYNTLSDLNARWDVFVDATNDARELEGVADVRYAIGHARTPTFIAQASEWDGSAAPRLGDDPPSCAVSGGCTTRSYRDPFLLARRTSADVLDDWALAFARQGDDGRYELRVEQDVSFSPDVPIGGEGVALLHPSEILGCDDLRDPAIIPLEQGGYFVAFSCRRDGGGDLFAMRLGSDFRPVAPLDIRLLLRDSEVGELGAGGLFGPELQVVGDPADELELRLWFVGRDRVGEASVLLATGQARATGGADASLWPPPAFQLYPANPVLRADDASLGGCESTCRLLGFAVAEDVDEPGAFRFLVARDVNRAGVMTSELIPLAQTWRAP